MRKNVPNLEWSPPASLTGPSVGLQPGAPAAAGGWRRRPRPGSGPGHERVLCCSWRCSSVKVHPSVSGGVPKTQLCVWKGRLSLNYCCYLNKSNVTTITTCGEKGGNSLSTTQLILYTAFELTKDSYFLSHMLLKIFFFFKNVGISLYSFCTCNCLPTVSVLCVFFNEEASV